MTQIETILSLFSMEMRLAAYNLAILLILLAIYRRVRHPKLPRRMTDVSSRSTIVYLRALREGVALSRTERFRRWVSRRFIRENADAEIDLPDDPVIYHGIGTQGTQAARTGASLAPVHSFMSFRETHLRKEPHATARNASAPPVAGRGKV